MGPNVLIPWIRNLTKIIFGWEGVSLCKGSGFSLARFLLEKVEEGVSLARGH